MTRAIFYDRSNDLVRCQLAGMNEKGEPEWLIIEQGEKSQTLTAKQSEHTSDFRYKMLCLEGEKLDKHLLMRIMASAIVGEIRGWGFSIDDISDFVDDMKKHHVEWPQDRISLRFEFRQDSIHPGKYVLSVYLDSEKVDYLMSEENIDDPNDWMSTIDEFCCMLEDGAGMDEPHKMLVLSRLEDFELDKEKAYFFNNIRRED